MLGRLVAMTLPAPALGLGICDAASSAPGSGAIPSREDDDDTTRQIDESLGAAEGAPYDRLRGTCPGGW